MMRPLFVLLVSAVFAAALSGCLSRDKKEKSREPQTLPEVKRPEQRQAELDAFVSRLREAVAARDMEAIAAMMTANFGYSLNPPLEGAGVFQYWDQNNIWPELAMVLREKFVPFGAYMVAPAAMANSQIEYHGYRAGIVRAGGEYRFAYFVTD